MRNLKMLCLGLLAVMLVPAVASATHFVGDVTFAADCFQWSADGLVQIRTGVAEAQLSTVITITPEAGGDPVLTLYDETTLMTDEDRIVDMNLGDLWNNMTEEIVPLQGTYVVHAVITLSGPYAGGIEEETVEFMVTMTCDVVANEEITWGAFKSIYR